MNVKAQGLLNAAIWVEKEHGREALRDILQACSPELRDRYTSAIAINWHPMSELVDFLAVADKLLGRGDGRIAEEIGAAGARSNMKGVFVRLLFYVTRPEFLMKRLAQLWRQFNDQGEMALLAIDEHTASIEVLGVDTPDKLFCCTITGWGREVTLAMGGSHPTVRHVECRARGGSRCLWTLRWQEAASDLAKRIEASSNRGERGDRDG